MDSKLFSRSVHLLRVTVKVLNSLRWINKMEKTDNSYIAIDLETTGLNPKTERIIEIGAARVEDGTVVQTYSTFVNRSGTGCAHPGADGNL